MRVSANGVRVRLINLIRRSVFILQTYVFYNQTVIIIIILTLITVTNLILRFGRRCKRINFIETKKRRLRDNICRNGTNYYNAYT